MGRVITYTKLGAMYAACAADPEALGPALGSLITWGNIPVAAVADVLNVSEPTIYRWMFGYAKPRDKDKIIKIKKFLGILRKAKQSMDLPMYGTMAERIAQVATMVKTYRQPAAEL